MFLCLPYLTEGVSSSVTSQAEIRRLVGAGTLDPYGYIVGVLFVVIAVAAICKMTSRYGVRRVSFKPTECLVIHRRLLLGAT